MTEIDLTGRAAALRSYPLTAYLARPERDGPWPDAVTVHEAFGLNNVRLRPVGRSPRRVVSRWPSTSTAPAARESA